MKKIFTFFVSLFCCLSMFAANDTIFYVNSTKWSTVSVHAWEGTAAGTTWPGKPATKASYQLQGFDVWYFVAAPGAYKKCIFNNNGAGAQTADLTWTPGKYYYKGVWYSRSELSGGTVTTKNDTVYFVNKDKWSTLKFYGWGGSGVSISWPGNAMKKATYKLKECDVWYYVAAPGDYGKCIFNDGSGQQTADLDWTAGKYYYGSAWYTRSELESGSVTPNPQGTFYITGTAELVGGNGWTAKEIKMTFNEATSTHTHTFKGLATGKEYKMKVTNGTWDKSWGFDAVKNAPAGVKADNDGNIVFHMAATGNVIVSFDGANITLQGNFGQGSVTPGLPTVVLAGEMNEWSTTANKFVPAKDSLTASVSVNLEAKTYQFKVVVDNTWQTNISATMTRSNCTNWAFSVMDGEETNAKITADVAGSYTFVWTYATNSLSVIYPNTSAVENVPTQKNATKYIQNGQLYIIRDGVRYNIMGQVVE